MHKGPLSKFFNYGGKRSFGNAFTATLYYWMCFRYFLGEPLFIYILFYIVVSLGGIVISPFFYTFHVLDIINRFESLRNVIKSVTRNSFQLVLTLLLGLFIVYLYSIIGFFFLTDTYYNSANNNVFNESLCANMLQCYLNSINYGFRSGGGIGDKLQPQTFGQGQESKFYVQWVFTFTFYWLINIIFLNIIFGIIIDTFAELRDEKSRKDLDMKNKCFICNLDRYTFDKNAEGFDVHIEKDHKLWNYLYYIYFIQNKDSTEYTGIESDVAEKVENEDITWFPMLRAMCLNEDDENAELGDFVNLKMMDIGKKVEAIHLGMGLKKFAKK